MTEEAPSRFRSDPKIPDPGSGGHPVHAAIVEGPISPRGLGFAAGDPGPAGAGGILTFHGILHSTPKQ